MLTEARFQSLQFIIFCVLRIPPMKQRILLLEQKAIISCIRQEEMKKKKKKRKKSPGRMGMHCCSTVQLLFAALYHHLPDNFLLFHLCLSHSTDDGRFTPKQLAECRQPFEISPFTICLKFEFLDVLLSI